jgi:hypothetical protein
VTGRARRKDDWLDDGRTVANMNVEGMPGYRRELDGRPGRAPETPRPKEMLTPSETRMVMLASMKWAFLYSMAFVAVMVLFILFCVKVWFA